MNCRHFLPLAATAVAGTAALDYYARDQAALTVDHHREDEPVHARRRPAKTLPGLAGPKTPGTAGAAHRLGLREPVQFVRRLSYPERYPEPVSMRRPVEWFVRV